MIGLKVKTSIEIQFYSFIQFFKGKMVFTSNYFNYNTRYNTGLIFIFILEGTSFTQ